MPNDWQPMATAPRDGTPILCLQESDEVEMFWSQRRY